MPACFRIADRELKKQLTLRVDAEFSFTHLKVRLSPKVAKEVTRRFDELKEFIKSNQASNTGASHLVTFSISKSPTEQTA